jgi:phosphate-selective porin OprO/OprP
MSYQGIKPFGGKLAIEGGIFDLPYALDEATSSNDILFLERASAGVVATNIAAGDFRSAIGSRWWNDVFWTGAYVTGPTTGQIHSGSSINPPGATEQYGVVARAAGQVVSGKDYSFHLGGDFEDLIQPSHSIVNGVVNGAQTLTLSDRPELRIDPTALVSTGAIPNVSSAQVYSVETAGTYGPLFFQGEYFWFNIQRGANTGLPPFGAPNLKFQGGYAEASYALTGETHTYNSATAAYNGIIPAHPFNLDGVSWGAWEIAARYSTIT